MVAPEANAPVINLMSSSPGRLPGPLCPDRSIEQEVKTVMDESAMGHPQETEHLPEVLPLQRILGQLPAVLWSTDRELRLTSLHGALLASLGLPSTKVTGVSLVALFGVESDAADTIRAHRRALRGESTRCDLVWQERTWQVQVEPLAAADGSTIGTVGIALDITPRAMAERALQQHEAHLSMALAAASAATWEWTLETDELVRSEGMAALYGLPAGALDGVLDTHFACIHPDDRGKIDEMDRKHLTEGAAYDVEYRVIWPDGSLHWLRERAQSVRNAHGRVIRLLGVTMDVTDRKAAEEALRQSEVRFRSLVEHSSDLITVVDAARIRRYASPSYEQVLGYHPDELIGSPIDEINHPEDVEVERQFFAALSRRPGAVDRYEIRVCHRDGSTRWLEAVATNRLDDPSVGGFVLNSRDVTERRRDEERLNHLAHHDPLTGLSNRALFVERLDEALDRVRRGAAPVAVLFLDLDGFKVVNDSLGHAVGDELLVAAARRLQTHLPLGATLARFGGDEFAVLLERITDPSEPVRAAEDLLAGLSTEFEVQGRTLYVTASVGIAVSTHRRSTQSDLLRDADTALYRAKVAGPGRYARFEPRMHAAMLERISQETALRRAVARGEFVLHYQPKVELATGGVIGAEALVRWDHPERGLLRPKEFIQLAEETGLIVPLGRWVLREACHQARTWLDSDPGVPLLICVNVAMRQLEEGSLITDVTEALAASGLDPCRLELELTESAAMRDAPEVRRILRDLHKLGVKLAIDDFGTGFSSLSRLRRRAFDTLKIDRSFIAGLGRDRDSLAIVRAVTTLAHDLGMGVTAEGVETAKQAAHLSALGVDYAQGYFFAWPVPAEQLPDLLGAALSPEAAHAIDEPLRTGLGG